MTDWERAMEVANEVTRGYWPTEPVDIDTEEIEEAIARAILRAEATVWRGAAEWVNRHLVLEWRFLHHAEELERAAGGCSTEVRSNNLNAIQRIYGPRQKG